jgi:hypothetical protein
MAGRLSTSRRRSSRGLALSLRDHLTAPDPSLAVQRIAGSIRIDLPWDFLSLQRSSPGEFTSWNQRDGVRRTKWESHADLRAARRRIHHALAVTPVVPAAQQPTERSLNGDHWKGRCKTGGTATRRHPCWSTNLAPRSDSELPLAVRPPWSGAEARSRWRSWTTMRPLARRFLAAPRHPLRSSDCDP